MVFKDTSGLRDELRAVIRSGRFLLIGPAPVHQYLQRGEPKDEDYLVDESTYRKVSAWVKSRHVVDRRTPDGFSALGVDVIRAKADAVLGRVFRSEAVPRRLVIPSVEALAAMKFVSFASPTRPPEKKRRDVIDFLELVEVRGFRRARYLSYFKTVPVAARKRAGALLKAAATRDMAAFLPYMA